MGVTAPHGVTPSSVVASEATAVYHQALATDAHLERERRGVAQPVRSNPRWRACIEDDGRATGGQSLEPDVAAIVQSLALDAGSGKHRVQQPPIPFLAAVKEGEAAVAQPQRPQHRRQSVDAAEKNSRTLDPCGLQRRTDIQKVAHDFKVQGRAALDMAAVRKNLAFRLAAEKFERRFRSPDTEAERGEKHSLTDSEGIGGSAGAAGDPPQVTGLYR
jgi:hypothetical protein